MENIIEIKNLTKTYKNGDKSTLTVLENINYTAVEGELIAIIGKSGSGKSTLLNILGCVDGFDSGEYLFCGTDTKKLSDKRRSALRGSEISFVFQDYALIEEETVLQNVMTPLYFGSSLKLGQHRKAAIKAIEMVGISEFAKKKVSCLSGGQKQRTAIARAIVSEPKLILADEPTGALDSETAESILNLLFELNKEGTTVIIVTHDEDVAKKCKRVLSISNGKIKEITC